VKYGPLSATADGLAVASVDDLHVRFTPSGVSHHRGSTPLAETIPWSDVTGIELTVPTSFVPYPGAFAVAGHALLTLLSQQVDDVRTEECTIAVTLVHGERREVPVTPAIGGYWKRAVTNAEVVLCQLIDRPDQRMLLAHPEQIVQRYARATRWRLRLASD